MYCSAESLVMVSGREDLLWSLAFLSYWILCPPTWADSEILLALQLNLNVFCRLPSQFKCGLAWFIIRIIRCSHTKDIWFANCSPIDKPRNVQWRYKLSLKDWVTPLYCHSHWHCALWHPKHIGSPGKHLLSLADTTLLCPFHGLETTESGKVACTSTN